MTNPNPACAPGFFMEAKTMCKRKQHKQPSEASREAARRYYDHHFHCPQCVAAGMGYGLERCKIGAQLWDKHVNT